jgi:hypothetical protein
MLSGFETVLQSCVIPGTCGVSTRKLFALLNMRWLSEVGQTEHCPSGKSFITRCDRFMGRPCTCLMKHDPVHDNLMLTLWQNLDAGTLIDWVWSFIFFFVFVSLTGRMIFSLGKRYALVMKAPEFHCCGKLDGREEEEMMIGFFSLCLSIN